MSQLHDVIRYNSYINESCLCFNIIRNITTQKMKNITNLSLTLAVVSTANAVRLNS